MKKIFKTLILLLLIAIPITFVKAETPDKVTMYVFYGSSCPHCQELEEYVATTLKKDTRVKDYLEVKYYEVWESESNASFMSTVGAQLGVEVKGVPFIVIGQKYFSGYGSTIDEKIVSIIVEQKNNEKYVDVVAELVKDTGAQLTESNPEPVDPVAEERITVEKDSKENNKIGITILLVVIGIVMLLIIIIIMVIIILVNKSK